MGFIWKWKKKSWILIWIILPLNFWLASKLPIFHTYYVWIYPPCIREISEKRQGWILQDSLASGLPIGQSLSGLFANSPRANSCWQITSRTLKPLPHFLEHLKKIIEFYYTNSTNTMMLFTLDQDPFFHPGLQSITLQNCCTIGGGWGQKN